MNTTNACEGDALILAAPQFELTTLTTLTAPQFDILASLELDDDARDQMGTFAVALFVGALATFARVAVLRKNRWWFNMILIHGAIFLYWLKSCHASEPSNPWLTTIHGGLCWRNPAGEFQQIAFWGGDRERLFLNALVWLAILGNVVPAYLTGNEASRHMTHVKRRACNPLINHIIAGVFCVIFPFFVVTFQIPIAIPIAVLLDIYHQITIHRLIANHDGIWVLRAVSMSLAISKWIVILNMYSSDAVGMLDQMFIMSTGFLGTRAYAATAYILYYCGLGDIKTAQWYSIGLMLADIGIMGRCWGQMRIAFWLTIVNCAAMHYHQMWKKFIHLRPAFVFACCVLATSVAHSGNFSSLLFTIVWSFSNFLLPHFNRFRPAPPKSEIFTPTVSTRPQPRMIERPKCPFAMMSQKRVSGFVDQSPSLRNSRAIVPKSARELMMAKSTRERDSESVSLSGAGLFAPVVPDVAPRFESEPYLMTPHSARSLMTPRTPSSAPNRPTSRSMTPRTPSSAPNRPTSRSMSNRRTPSSARKLLTPTSERSSVSSASSSTTPSQPTICEETEPENSSGEEPHLEALRREGLKGRRSTTGSPCPSPMQHAQAKIAKGTSTRDIFASW